MTDTIHKNYRGMSNMTIKLALREIQRMHTNMLMLKWLDPQEVYILTTLVPDTVVYTSVYECTIYKKDHL